MRYTKDRIAKTPAQDAVTLKLRSGGLVTLPRVEIGTDSDGPIAITDFSTIDPCDRCETHPEPDGSIPSGGGIIRVYAIHRGVWTAYAAACDCVFGAWRAVPHKYKMGGTWATMPAMRYADDLPGIPTRISNAEWTLLNVFRRPGDGYLQAARRIPPDTDGLPELIAVLVSWVRKEAQG